MTIRYQIIPRRGDRVSDYAGKIADDIIEKMPTVGPPPSLHELLVQAARAGYTVGFAVGFAVTS